MSQKKQERVEALLDAISRYKALPREQQEELKPIFSLTLKRFDEHLHTSDVFEQYLSEIGA